MVGGLGGLLELRLSDNKLAALPREIGLLRALRVLVADNNLLTALPGANLPVLAWR
jgi:Leucine-rich repeat (LRR) protein